MDEFRPQLPTHYAPLGQGKEIAHHHETIGGDWLGDTTGERGLPHHHGFVRRFGYNVNCLWTIGQTMLHDGARPTFLRCNIDTMGKGNRHDRQKGMTNVVAIIPKQHIIKTGLWHTRKKSAMHFWGRLRNVPAWCRNRFHDVSGVAQEISGIWRRMWPYCEWGLRRFCGICADETHRKGRHNGDYFLL